MADVHFEHLPPLEGADVLDKELNRFSYNPDEYPDASKFVRELLKMAGQPSVKIDLDQLSVNGAIKREDMAVYLASKNNGSSALKAVVKNPASYYFYIHDKDNFIEKPKPHLDLGTFAHEAFLEPHLFKMVKVEPKYGLARKDDVLELIKFYEKVNEAPVSEACDKWKMDDLKIYLQDLKDQCPYKIIKEEHQLIISLIERNYYRYGGGIIPTILKGAVSEASFYYKDPETGIDLKVRPDSFNIAENIGHDAVISFKTTSADSVGKFLYDSAKYMYDLSEGMYQEALSHVTGRKFNTTIMIMLQTVPPYLPAVFIWNPDDIAAGKYKYRYALDTIRDCRESGIYPGFEAMAESNNYGIIDMALPEWAHKLIHPTDVEN